MTGTGEPLAPLGILDTGLFERFGLPLTYQSAAPLSADRGPRTAKRIALAIFGTGHELLRLAISVVKPVQLIRPSSRARTTASVRLAAPSLASTCVTCFFTVSSVTTRRSAIR